MASYVDKELYQRVGFAVMKIRERRGLTVLALAERAGMHRNSLARVESGLGTSVASLFRIATVLEVSVDALITFSQDVVQRATGCESVRPKAAKVVCGTERLF
jgi:transcriptional regulator with XRE-family HTH domain